VMLKPSPIALFTHINARLAVFFPPSVFLALIIYSLFRRQKYAVPVYQLTLIITCFLLVMPFFIPNAGGKQWGPRYLLPVIPAMLTLFGLVYSTGTSWKANARRWMLVLASVGFIINICVSYITIRDDYRNRVAPALSWINADWASVVIFQNQYISQEMAAAFSRKDFFVAESEETLTKLVHELSQAGVGRINYLCNANGPGPDPEILKKGLISSIIKGNYRIITCDISPGIK
ncbi:MAG: hypothetical protein ABI151_02825, partial [Chitinophagaceae bacterium]